MLPIQVGSINAFREVGCSVQVFPKSEVMQTRRPFSSLFPRLRLSRIFSMMFPSDSCTAIHSVTFVKAGLLALQVLPPSLLQVILENGCPSLSRPCVGKTRVPSCSVIPCPGAGAYSHHSFRLVCSVMIPGLTVIGTFCN